MKKISRFMVLLSLLVLWNCSGDSGTSSGTKDTAGSQDMSEQDGQAEEVSAQPDLNEVAQDVVAEDVVDLVEVGPDLAVPDLGEGELWSDIPFDFKEDNTLVEGCGNGLIESGESCDGGTKPCKELIMNFTGGTAYCKPDCSGWSTVGCITNGKPYCGNGKKEGLEACDGDPKECTELGTDWTGGVATCSFDCGTYDIGACTTDVAPYGYVDIDFTSGYVFNDAKIGDTEYLAGHPEGVVMAAAITGQYGSTQKQIPNPDAQATVSLALRNTQKQWLYIVQESLSEVNEEIVYNNPQFEMHFAYSNIALGDYPMNFQVMGATRLYMFNYKPDGSKCLAAVGIGGYATVSNAVGTSDDEGGQLAFTASQVPLYHVTQSPYGQALVDSFPIEICPKE